MRIGIEKLVKGYSVHEGNHSCHHVVKDDLIVEVDYYYHGNLVCVADLMNQTYKLDSCGYYGRQSTMQTLSQYRRWYSEHEFLEIFAEEWYMLTQLENLPVGKMLRCYLEHTQSGHYYSGTQLQVTMSVRQLDKDKFATVEFALDGAPYPCTVELKYRGAKTFMKQWLDKCVHALDNYCKSMNSVI